MINQTARQKYGELLRHFASGRMTNRHYESASDDVIEVSADDAVGAIFSGIWGLYDDFRVYRLSGKHRLDRATRRIVARCVLFLQTDKEYVAVGLSQRELIRQTVNSLTFGLVPKSQAIKDDEQYEQEVWPFACTEDFADARTRPHLLSASR